MDHIFFSPHADDAVASCGGTMARLVSEDELVTIHTIFCGPPVRPFSPATKELHRLWGDPKDVTRLRRAEDAAAAARVGASIGFGDIPEAIYRRDQHGNWLYVELDEIFGARRCEDDGLPARLAEEIRASFNVSKARLYFPLGIGWHVDHLIMFEAGQGLSLEGYDVFFYEDLPYAAKDSDRNGRMAALAHFQREIIRLGEVDISAKIEAFSYYRSQIPMLFRSHSNMCVELIDYAKGVSGSNDCFGERFWFDARTRNPLML
jgi:hypothetical protein